MSLPHAAPSAELRARYVAGGQGHVFEHLDAGRVSSADAAAFLAQLEGIDVTLVNDLYRETMAAGAATAAAMSAAGAAGSAPAADALQPCTDVTCLATTPAEQLAAWRAGGLEAIAAGRAAALMLAGGQGTRLGFDRPKGEYDIGLPSRRSLFALHAARIQRLRVLASRGGPLPSLPLYVMTSPMTDADTRAHWAGAGYYGLPAADVVFFSQGTLPCLALAPPGAIMLESGGRVAEAPDGNGGIYRALHTCGVVADLQRRGVEGVHVFAVDNAAVRAADPVFLGLCLGGGADVGSKVCAKAGPHERVGVLCRNRDGAHTVVEYSEMARADAEARDARGELVFNAGNLCIHYYSTAFLAGPCSPDSLPKVYHVARKAIPCADPATGATRDRAAMAAAFGAAPNGIKLESFIFDVFPAAKAMAVAQIQRAHEFAPVKNAPGAPDDSPDTARAIVAELHAAWLRAAGAALAGPTAALVEVSAAASYAGEGLEALAGAALEAPLLLLAHGEALPHHLAQHALAGGPVQVGPLWLLAQHEGLRVYALPEGAAA